MLYKIYQYLFGYKKIGLNPESKKWGKTAEDRNNEESKKQEQTTKKD